MNDKSVEEAYRIARDCFAEQHVDTDQVIEQLNDIPVSFQCWQGDDVLGFEVGKGNLTGGIQVTGNYPGRARCAAELRADLETAFSLVPGKKRVNLHAIYLEAESRVDRESIEPSHFKGWIDWAKERTIGLDFNPTCFSHPNSAQNLTLSHPDPGIRRFWIDHCIASRKISEHMGRELNNPVIMNIWIPDGFKDSPADRLGPRQLLLESLDEIRSSLTGERHKIAVEGKLFGIGAESYTVGSNEFYMGYASTRKTLLCLDAGHFHPTEEIADKISTTLCFVDEILLHVSRPVRWDSDHVVLFDEATVGVCQEVVRCGALNRVHFGLDFFDASINRVAAWVIGARNLRKALLYALLEPSQEWAAAERAFDFTRRLVLMEEQKSMPWPAVWDYYCLHQSIPVRGTWYETVLVYERDMLNRRA